VGDAIADTAVALPALGAELRSEGWELALEVVEEGLRDDVIPSLARLGRLAQLGDLPTFITELGREVELPSPGRMRVGGPLAAVAREHARLRESLGFAPREIVTELLLLRRVLWRFVATRVVNLASGDLFEVERRLNDTIDRLVTECVVAYFDGATADLADQARGDPLTRLLNHHAFWERLEREVERAVRYDHGLTLVFIDLDRFKAVNDTYGHLEGDRVLNRFAGIAAELLRGSDVAGRLGGDEFGVLLLEADRLAGERFLSRLRAGLTGLQAGGGLPEELDLSAGCAHFPSEAPDARSLLRLADARQYEAKRAKQGSSRSSL
jgi:diguanylate cyclase (GGDEF)-like protein